uniref:Protein asteroid 1 n=1 Tax=Aceria tosichella TaxID=561515 RepID=A0A6G1SJY5_9ACAR
MGVRGLKSFIEKHDGLLEDDYHLHDTRIVIDANNLVCVLYKRSQKHERRDLFGGDMVQYGRYLNLFFSNLRQCKIEPVLVFDGAQTYEENKNKTPEKHKRALERFENVMSISKLGFGDFTLPATATNVFRSVAVDLDIEIVQCMYEADAEVARISNDLKCPVISNDSDFFLMNLPHGLITTDSLEHEHIRRHPSLNGDDNGPSYQYMECCFYKQSNFIKYIPDLDVRSLSLVGVLAGNDYVCGKVYEQICDRLPLRRIYNTRPGCGLKSFRKFTNNKQHEKIVKILHYLGGKSLNETINLLCSQVPKEKRQEVKESIKSSLLVYAIPTHSDFKFELSRLYWQGFVSTYSRQLNNDQFELKRQFEATMDQLVEWLKLSMEHSVLSYRCLEIANHNTIFIMEHMDDPTLTSAHACQIRCIRVMLALLRSTYNEKNYCLVYSRLGNGYKKQVVRPLKQLDNAGILNYTFFDLPTISPIMRRTILLATFHANCQIFNENLIEYTPWFELYHAEEFLTMKLLMDFVDFGHSDAHLWKQFRQAVLLCMMYHYYKDKRDQAFLARLESNDHGGIDIDTEFMDNLVSLIKARKFNKMPVLSKKRLYNCRLMHQITQIQSAIICFNTLNAFLGDVMNRLRSEGWLNSCLIYNLAEGLRYKTLRLPCTPSIIHNLQRAQNDRQDR